MNKTILFIAVTLFIQGALFAQGDTYSTTNINNQQWMTTNLNVNSFRNGDAIAQAKTEEEWEAFGVEKKPAWCYYNYDPSMGDKYGKLYNFHAVEDARGLAPSGWKIPSYEEMKEMSESLGNWDVVVDKLKASSGWSDEGSGINSSGFDARPAGHAGWHGDCVGEGTVAKWWSSTEKSGSKAWSMSVNSPGTQVNWNYPSKRNGLSVRCKKKQ